MTPGPLKAVAPGAPLQVVLNAMVDHGINQVPVIDEGRVVGLLTRADLLRVLRTYHPAPRQAAASFGPFRF
jgi:predicted transcriptional regulator